MSTIAVVTGATGGLGKAFIARLLKEDVDEIWAVARNREKLDALCREYGERIFPVVCDLSKGSEVEKLRDLFAEKNPDILFLINNAGVAKMGKIIDFSEKEINDMIEINCKTPALLCQYAIPYMRAGARILNVSSASSFQPNPYIALYSATKAFLRSYSRSLNYEWKEKGIVSTAVCPGWIDTGMLRSEKNGKKIKFPGLVSPERVVIKAIKDAKKGKDMSVCSLFVKYEHLCSKLYPQRWLMRVWGKSVKKYVED